MEDSQKNTKLSETNLENPSHAQEKKPRKNAELDQNSENLIAQAREEMQKRLTIEMARIFGQ